MNIESLEKNILHIGRQAKEASRYVSQLSTKSKNEILCSAADNLLKNKESILKANELDIKEKEGIILTNVAAIKVTKGVNSLISLPEKVKNIIINN